MATVRLVGVDFGSWHDVGQRRFWSGRPPVISDAFEQALRRQIGEGRSSLSLRQLCEACADATSMRTSIVLVTDGHQQAAMAASDGAAAMEELQLTLGEGPGLDAYGEGQPVLVEDLADEASRWLHFVPAARDLGVEAVFAFPLQLGVVRTGVLSLYGDGAGPLGDGVLGDLSTLADLVTEAVLTMQSGAAPEELGWSFSSAAEHRAVVHQATGMVVVQLDCSAQDAFVRLRARAFALGVEVDEVARLVVERQMRFER